MYYWPLHVTLFAARVRLSKIRSSFPLCLLNANCCDNQCSILCKPKNCNLTKN